MENYRMFLTKSIVYTYIFLIQYVLFSFLKLNRAETEGGGGGEWIRNIMQGSIAARTLGCYKILPVWRRV